MAGMKITMECTGCGQTFELEGEMVPGPMRAHYTFKTDVTMIPVEHRDHMIARHAVLTTPSANLRQRMQCLSCKGRGTTVFASAVQPCLSCGGNGYVLEDGD